MEKIAVVSDIHGNIPALETVNSDIKKRGIQKVLNLGDHLSGPLWPAETADFLMNSDWIHISGNHDRQLISGDKESLGLSDRQTYPLLTTHHKEWLSSLPFQKYIYSELFLFHGTPGNDAIYLLETVKHGKAELSSISDIKEKLKSNKAAVILCGHSHVPRTVKIDETIIINPGSIGLQAYDDTTPEPHIIETGSPHARYSIIEKTNAGWIIDHICIEYDFETAARQAAKNNRRDWETALRTGFFKL